MNKMRGCFFGLLVFTNLSVAQTATMQKNEIQQKVKEIKKKPPCPNCMQVPGKETGSPSTLTVHRSATHQTKATPDKDKKDCTVTGQNGEQSVDTECLKRLNTGG
ncbi:MAG TPA: hypothetical protein VF450_17820 [Noviherbaspirillum sp.]